MSSPKKKNKIKVSVIIPAFNQAQNLPNLITTLLSIAAKDLEIIVVDDASLDNTSEIVKNFSVKYHRLKYNCGPAKARNTGAKLAKGNILVFLDADVIPLKNSISEALKLFSDPKIKAVSGMWVKTQSESNFFSEYKALRDWSFYFKESDRKSSYFFNTRVGMIRKKTFVKVGGFNTSFKKADLESYEFSFRLNKITSINFCPKFIVKHSYKIFWIIIKNYFKRTYYFLDLYSIYHQFGRVGATKSEATAVIFSICSIFLLVLSLIESSFIYLFLIFFTAYIYRVRQFLVYFYCEKGFIFTLKSFFTNWILHLIIFAGVITYIITRPFVVRKLK